MSGNKNLWNKADIILVDDSLAGASSFTEQIAAYNKNMNNLAAAEKIASLGDLNLILNSLVLRGSVIPISLKKIPKPIGEKDKIKFYVENTLGSQSASAAAQFQNALSSVIAENTATSARIEFMKLDFKNPESGNVYIVGENDFGDIDTEIVFRNSKGMCKPEMNVEGNLRGVARNGKANTYINEYLNIDTAALDSISSYFKDEEDFINSFSDLDDSLNLSENYSFKNKLSKAAEKAGASAAREVYEKYSKSGDGENDADISAQAEAAASSAI